MIRTLVLAAALSAAAVFPAAGVRAQSASELSYSEPLNPAAVREVQQKLQQAGTYSGSVDGTWGPDSRTALEKFQQNRGLQVTGQLNRATVATLGLTAGDLLNAGNAQSAGSTGTPPPSGASLDKPAVQAVQRQLKQLGFYNGNPDGVWGPGTQSSIERFQQSRGLQANGQLNPNTISALGLDPNNLSGRRR